MNFVQLPICIMHIMETDSTQIVLDAARLQREIHHRGFSSVQDFADAVGVHRNTVGNYLSGKTALPSALAKMLAALDLAPAEVLSLRLWRRQVPGLLVSDLIGALHTAVPEAAFALFGSRARGRAKRYSDYDIGVFRLRPLEFPTFSRLLDRVSAWNEESLVMAQLVDLTHAEASFLRGLAEDLIFLAGSHAAWCELLRKTGMQLHEQSKVTTVGCASGSRLVRVQDQARESAPLCCPGQGLRDHLRIHVEALQARGYPSAFPPIPRRSKAADWLIERSPSRTQRAAAEAVNGFLFRTRGGRGLRAARRPAGGRGSDTTETESRRLDHAADNAFLPPHACTPPGRAANPGGAFGDILDPDPP